MNNYGNFMDELKLRLSRIKFLDVDGYQVCLDKLHELLHKDDYLWHFVQHHDLPELEFRYACLNSLLRHIWCSRNRDFGLTLKPPYTYDTNEGYYLGSQVWAFDIVVEGKPLSIYGGSPEDAVAYTIQVYTVLRTLENNEFKRFLKSFLESQKQQASVWTKY